MEYHLQKEHVQHQLQWLVDLELLASIVLPEFVAVCLLQPEIGQEQYWLLEKQHQMELGWGQNLVDQRWYPIVVAAFELRTFASLLASCLVVLGCWEWVDWTEQVEVEQCQAIVEDQDQQP